MMNSTSNHLRRPSVSLTAQAGKRTTQIDPAINIKPERDPNVSLRK